MTGRSRRLLAWAPAVLIVPVAMAVSISVVQPDDEGSELTELQPLDLGTTWVYDVLDHGKPSGTHTRQVSTRAAVDMDRFDGVAMTGAYTAYPGRGRSSNVAYYSVDDDTMYQDGLRQDGQYLDLEPAAPVYELPLGRGSSWSYDGTIGTAQLTSVATVEEVGPVEVGGREFEDCLHVVTEMDFTFESGGGDPETVEEWTCPGYGTVRSIDTIPAQDVEITEELTAFHGRAGSWFADEPGPVTADPEPGDTIGFDAGRTRAVPDGELESTLAWTDLRNADIAYPPVSDGDVMVLGEEDGLVTGMDVATGEMRWRRQVTAPVIAPLAIGAGRVLVADTEKALWALGTDDGSARWVHHFEDVVSTSPVLDGSQVVVVTDDGRVSALDLATGRTVWEHDIGLRARSAPAVVGDLVVVPDVGGRLVALDLEDGSPRWSRSLEGALMAGPAASEDLILAADDGGVIYALDARDGDIGWETRIHHDPFGDFAVSADAVTLLVGPERVESFDLADGDARWSRRIPETAQSPVAVGEEVITVSREAEVSVRSLADGQETRSWSLPGPGPGPGLNADVPLGLVAGSLVIGTEVNAEAQTTGLFAYPVTPAAVRNGVSFGSDVRVFPTGPMSAPALLGDTLFLPGFDNTLYRSTGTRGAAKVATSTSIQPGVAVRDDLVVVQIDDEIRGYPGAGGDLLWRFPAVAPLPGAVPAIGDGVVFVPEFGVGLAGLSTEGDPLWFTPIERSVGLTQPLPLPGGDVFYGSGTTSRYDGSTGDRLWSIKDAVLFAPAAYAEGIVFADLVRNNRASGLAAIDAGTGRIRWFHENFNNQLYVGPAAADGVVVYGDSLGLVLAFDAASGTELWRTQLSTPMAGPPVISEGRVYLTESGRSEDLFQRDYRMSAHDLRTGAFLGAYQPPGTVFSGSPSFAGSQDGRLLIPGTNHLGSVVVILEPRP